MARILYKCFFCEQKTLLIFSYRSWAIILMDVLPYCVSTVLVTYVADVLITLLRFLMSIRLLLREQLVIAKTGVR